MTSPWNQYCASCIDTISFPMQNRVYVTTRYPSVCPSVCLSVCLSQHGHTAENRLLEVCCFGPGGQATSIHSFILFCFSNQQSHAVAIHNELDRKATKH